MGVVLVTWFQLRSDYTSCPNVAAIRARDPRRATQSVPIATAIAPSHDVVSTTLTTTATAAATTPYTDYGKEHHRGQLGGAVNRESDSHPPPPACAVKPTDRHAAEDGGATAGAAPIPPPVAPPMAAAAAMMPATAVGPLTPPYDSVSYRYTLPEDGPARRRLSEDARRALNQQQRHQRQQLQRNHPKQRYPSAPQAAPLQPPARRSTSSSGERRSGSLKPSSGEEGQHLQQEERGGSPLNAPRVAGVRTSAGNAGGGAAGVSSRHSTPFPACPPSAGDAGEGGAPRPPGEVDAGVCRLPVALAQQFAVGQHVDPTLLPGSGVLPDAGTAGTWVDANSSSGGNVVGLPGGGGAARGHPLPSQQQQLLQHPLHRGSAGTTTASNANHTMFTSTTTTATSMSGQAKVMAGPVWYSSLRPPPLPAIKPRASSARGRHRQKRVAPGENTRYTASTSEDVFTKEGSTGEALRETHHPRRLHATGELVENECVEENDRPHPQHEAEELEYEEQDLELEDDIDDDDEEEDDMGPMDCADALTYYYGPEESYRPVESAVFRAPAVARWSASQIRSHYAGPLTEVMGGAGVVGEDGQRARLTAPGEDDETRDMDASLSARPLHLPPPLQLSSYSLTGATAGTSVVAASTAAVGGAAGGPMPHPDRITFAAADPAQPSSHAEGRDSAWWNGVSESGAAEKGKGRETADRPSSSFVSLVQELQTQCSRHRDELAISWRNVDRFASLAAAKDGAGGGSGGSQPTAPATEQRESEKERRGGERRRRRGEGEGGRAGDEPSAGRHGSSRDVLEETRGGHGRSRAGKKAAASGNNANGRGDVESGALTVSSNTNNGVNSADEAGGSGPRRVYYMGPPQYMTYGALWTSVQAFGWGLRSLGLKPGDTVGLLDDTRWEWLVTCYAAWSQGLVLVVLHDTQRCMEQVAKDANDMRVVVCKRGVLARLRRLWVQARAWRSDSEGDSNGGDSNLSALDTTTTTATTSAAGGGGPARSSSTEHRGGSRPSRTPHPAPPSLLHGTRKDPIFIITPRLPTFEGGSGGVPAAARAMSGGEDHGSGHPSGRADGGEHSHVAATGEDDLHRLSEEEAVEQEEALWWTDVLEHGEALLYEHRSRQNQKRQQRRRERQAQRRQPPQRRGGVAPSGAGQGGSKESSQLEPAATGAALTVASAVNVNPRGGPRLLPSSFTPPLAPSSALGGEDRMTGAADPAAAAAAACGPTHARRGTSPSGGDSSSSKPPSVFTVDASASTGSASRHTSGLARQAHQKERQHEEGGEEENAQQTPLNATAPHMPVPGLAREVGVATTVAVVSPMVKPTTINTAHVPRYTVPLGSALPPSTAERLRAQRDQELYEHHEGTPLRESTAETVERRSRTRSGGAALGGGGGGGGSNHRRPTAAAATDHDAAHSPRSGATATTPGSTTSTSVQPVTLRDSDLALIVYTDGDPKGVLLTHGALKAAVAGYVERFSEMRLYPTLDELHQQETANAVDSGSSSTGAGGGAVTGDSDSDGRRGGWYGKGLQNWMNQRVYDGLAGTAVRLPRRRTNVHRPSYVAYLPVHTVSELVAEVVFLQQGFLLCYGSPSTLMDAAARPQGDLATYKPLVLAAVPHTLDEICAKVRRTLTTGYRKTLFDIGYEARRQAIRRGLDTPFLNQSVFYQPRQLLGGRCKLVLSSRAPLHPKTHEYLQVVCGVSVAQVYGLAESAGCATMQLYWSGQLDSVGGPLGTVELKLRDVEGWQHNSVRPSGELLLRGPTVMVGYYRQPERTAAALEESGWLHTGDIAERCPDGSFRIVGRLKNSAKNSRGGALALETLERLYGDHPLCVPGGVCVLVHPYRPYIAALVLTDQRRAEAFVRQLKQQRRATTTTTTTSRSSSHNSSDSVAVQDGRAREVDTGWHSGAPPSVNGGEGEGEVPDMPNAHWPYCLREDWFNQAAARSLAASGRARGAAVPQEVVRVVRVLYDEWSVRNGMRTSTGRIRRSMIELRYHDIIDELFAHETL